LKAKGYLVISEAGKKSHLSCNHETPISPELGRDSMISPKLSNYAPAALWGWPAGSLWGADVPPMIALHQNGTGLTAQSAFPSGPLASFHYKFDQLIWR
jgi:hypothetical protein